MSEQRGRKDKEAKGNEQRTCKGGTREFRDSKTHEQSVMRMRMRGSISWRGYAAETRR